MANKRVFMRVSEIAEEINKKRGRKKTKINGKDVHRLISGKKIVPSSHLKRVVKKRKGGQERLLFVRATPQIVSALTRAWEEKQRFNAGYLNTRQLAIELKGYDVRISSDDITWLIRKRRIRHAEKYGRRWFFRTNSVAPTAELIKNFRRSLM